MKAVVYYSNTSQSKTVAEQLASLLKYEIFDIFRAPKVHFETLVLVFPVHCQGVPGVIKSFFATASIEHLACVATYGKMCHGDPLHEIQKKYYKNIIAGAYIPTKHAYIDGDTLTLDRDCLERLAEKIASPSVIKIPRSYKNLLASPFSEKRSRIAIRIERNEKCTSCGKCTDVCNHGAIVDGITNKSCVRCLRCVQLCPKGALRAKASLPLKLYLRRKKSEKYVIYV